MLDGIPKYLGSLCSLETLYFDENSVVVKFLDFLDNLSGCTSLALKELDASNSQFTGISEKLWELSGLELLDVSFNNLTVPSTYHLSSLSYVKAIDLLSCKIVPHFPKWIQTLKNLVVLDLSNTGISNTIPLKFWDMWASPLTYLNLSSNNISGKVSDLSSYFADESIIIYLSSNSFNGPILNVPSTLFILNPSRNKFS
ncbi:unnamed protein product [Lactuca saligna]|uniref:Non-specific serine/threonine protein kinase n=1 Tax=Lactuca saligna TaxID=75948 RepID=A0AA36EQ28_LACSI|nr:unnamed protein product [Lactuca saligna]